MSSNGRGPVPTANYQGYQHSRPGVELPNYNDITPPTRRSVDPHGATSGDETDGDHRRMSIDESDASSIDENLEVVSIASSIEDQLTYVLECVCVCE